MTTKHKVPPPPSDLPSWIVDPEAKAEEKNWDKEGRLRGQEERNHLLWLKGYGFVIIIFLFFLAFLSSWLSCSWVRLPLGLHTTFYRIVITGLHQSSFRRFNP